MPRAETQSEQRLEELRLKKKRRQRFWGALVLIAVAVIVLPLLLDGAGTQSQFRRVESLQKEPESEGTEGISERASAQSVTSVEAIPEPPQQTNTSVLSESAEGRSSDSTRAAGSTQPVIQAETDQAPAEGRALLTAWVIQAATFSDESDALQLRDRLRQAGFASFVRDRNASSDPFRVLVGPMIKESTAQKVKIQVAKMLNLEFPSINTDPEIMVYP